MMCLLEICFNSPHRCSICISQKPPKHYLNPAHSWLPRNTCFHVRNHPKLQYDAMITMPVDIFFNLLHPPRKSSCLLSSSSWMHFPFLAISSKPRPGSMLPVENWVQEIRPPTRWLDEIRTKLPVDRNIALWLIKFSLNQSRVVFNMCRSLIR